MSHGFSIGDRVEVLRDERVINNGYGARVGDRGRIVDLIAGELAAIVFDHEAADVYMGCEFLRRIDVVEQLAELA